MEYLRQCVPAKDFVDSFVWNTPMLLQITFLFLRIIIVNCTVNLLIVSVDTTTANFTPDFIQLYCINMQPSIILSKTKKYMIHLIKHRRIQFMYAIVIIVLTVIAIYSAYSVLMDFLYNNVMTSIKMNTTDDILPFVQYFSVFYYFKPLPSYSGRCK